MMKINIELVQDKKAPIDVQVLDGQRNPAWLARALGSLEAHEVNVWVAKSDDTNLGSVRAAAFQYGSAPFVSVVDDDDVVLPGAFKSLLNVASRVGYVGAYSEVLWCDGAGKVVSRNRKSEWAPQKLLAITNQMTHLAVVRRTAIAPFLSQLENWPVLELEYLFAQASRYGVWHKSPIDGYRKTVGPHGAHHRVKPEDRNRLANELTKVTKDSPLRRFLNTDTGCGTCNKVRQAANRLTGG